MDTTQLQACPAREQQGELSNVERANSRLLGEVRALLVGAALLLALFEPVGSERTAVWPILVAYALLTVGMLGTRAGSGAALHSKIGHWLDLACYLGIVACTGGPMSRFTMFLLFPILVACVQRGLRSGIAVAFTCASCLVAYGLLDGDAPAQALLHDVPLRSIALVLVASAVIVRWGLAEVTILRRLAFTNDINRIFDPRQELRQAITRFAGMLAAYHGAQSCLVVVKGRKADAWMLIRAGTDGREEVRDVDAPVVQPLLAMPADRVVVFADSRPLWRRAQCAAYDLTTRRRRDVHDDEQAAQLAQLLEARYLVSLPLRSPNETVGFIHLVCRTARYGATDVDFLAQAAAQAGLMIENMTLVDRLAKERARQERTKISRDLHDGTIQPYIGLKLALEALQRKVGHDPLLAHEVSELTKMASDGISELRLYVGTLKSRSDREQRLALLPAIRVQAEKFSDYCGISTGVTGDGDISVTAALFDEVMHIVREALSNIRRHTQARHASIHVSVREGVLALQFSNDAGGGAAPGEFFPRCIGERAKELAGRVNVGRLPDGRTVVAVELPV